MGGLELLKGDNLVETERGDECHEVLADGLVFGNSVVSAEVRIHS